MLVQSDLSGNSSSCDRVPRAPDSRVATVAKPRAASGSPFVCRPTLQTGLQSAVCTSYSNTNNAQCVLHCQRKVTGGAAGMGEDQYSLCLAAEGAKLQRTLPICWNNHRLIITIVADSRLDVLYPSYSILPSIKGVHSTQGQPVSSTVLSTVREGTSCLSTG